MKSASAAVPAQNKCFGNSNAYSCLLICDIESPQHLVLGPSLLWKIWVCEIAWVFFVTKSQVARPSLKCTSPSASRNLFRNVIQLKPVILWSLRYTVMWSWSSIASTNGELKCLEPVRWRDEQIPCKNFWHEQEGSLLPR